MDLTLHAISLGDNLHEVSNPIFTISMKCQILFSRKNKKNISKCHVLEFLSNMQSVKICKIYRIYSKYWDTISLPYLSLNLEKSILLPVNLSKIVLDEW